MMNNCYTKAKALYIHIPFCNKICPYCDFPKMVGSLDFKEKYLQSLFKEFELKKLYNYSFQTLYIGGGTPSALPKELINELLVFLNNNLNYDHLQEFTFECNIEDIDFELINLLKIFHVNRISVGVQTFNSNFQKMINRIYSYEFVKSKIEIIKSLIPNFSIDIIYGFNHETIQLLEEDLKLAISLKPTHISTYCLSIEEHTIFGINKNKTFNAPEEEQEKEYYFIQDYLTKYDYQQYEISNFSFSGFESIHNQTYWESNSYEAIGAGASSFVNQIHYKNLFKMNDYMNNLSLNLMPPSEIEHLDLDDLIEEYVIMNLRLLKGIDLEKFNKRFNLNLFDYYQPDKFIKQDLLIYQDNHLFINPKKLFISNYIIVNLISTHKE